MNISGSNFETAVADLFRLLGYRVEQNVLLCGQQVDLLLEFALPGGRVSRTVVECKYRRSGNIGNEIVNDFSGAFLNAQRQGLADFGMIVTNVDYTNTAKLAAVATNVQLSTYGQLLANLIDFVPYLTRVTSEYENHSDVVASRRPFVIEIMERCDLSKFYVPLSYETIAGERRNLDPFINDWIEHGSQKQLAILGDYGTGKSSFCLHLTYQFAKRYLSAPETSRIPVFVSLKDYNKAISVEQLLTDLLVNRYGVRIHSYAVFEKLLETKMLLLIFDGFDEMVNKSDKQTTVENFTRISKLAKGDTKIILTCRTHYFTSRISEKKLFSSRASGLIGKSLPKKIHFDRIYLAEFTTTQIRLFLQKHTSEWNRIWNRIQQTYNLEDLAKRPVLLDMIFNTIDDIKERGDITICDLYETYTDIWIEREDWHAAMTAEGKRSFMETLAIVMCKGGRRLQGERDTVHYSELPVPLKEHFKDKIVTRDDLDYYDHDARTCSFLNRTPSGEYKFIHKSFMEYFVAIRLARLAADGSFSEFDRVMLTPEIAGFLIPQCTSDEVRTQIFEHVLIHNGFSLFRRVFGLSSKAKGALERALKNKNCKGPERAKAVYYLAKIGAIETAPLIENVARSDPYPYARELAAVALNMLGKP